jgi:hypothetical protein
MDSVWLTTGLEMDSAGQDLPGSEAAATPLPAPQTLADKGVNHGAKVAAPGP